MKTMHNITTCNQFGRSQGHKKKATHKYNSGSSAWGKLKSLWIRGRFAKKIVNKIYKINLINNTTDQPHITVNGYGIADSGSTLHFYRRDTPTDNGCTAAGLHTVHPNRSQIVSTLQADMKVSTLNNEARREYKFFTLTQNLVSLPVLAYNGCNITLDSASINVTKGIK